MVIGQLGVAWRQEVFITSSLPKVNNKNTVCGGKERWWRRGRWRETERGRGEGKRGKIKGESGWERGRHGERWREQERDSNEGRETERQRDRERRWLD
jgi:hypothetical protein